MTTTGSDIAFAVIGGSGLYELPGLRNVERSMIGTPCGKPSAPIVIGELAGHRVAFLARHGLHHRLPPHRVNYRANLWALNHLGVRRVIGVNAVGGIADGLPPETIAVPDQMIDYTWGRAATFYDGDNGEVRHVDFTDPYTGSLRQALLGAAAAAGVAVVDGGCYGATQGPRLETRAEIARMRHDGCTMVGMTGMPEAALARELGLEYASLALVANWAAGCGPDTADVIRVDDIYQRLERLTAKVPAIVKYL